MTLEFYGKTFHEYEITHFKPYIGYFSPGGKLINYNDDLGKSHDTLGNIVPWTFLLWIKQSNFFQQLLMKKEYLLH